MKNKKFRIEKDSMGSMKVPEDALYGSQTQRAVENFPISNIPFNSDFINAIIIIKRSAAIVNHKLGLLDENISDKIVNISNQLLDGDYKKHFPVDMPITIDTRLDLILGCQFLNLHTIFH